MKIAKKACISLAVLPVLLIAKPVGTQLEVQGSMREATLALVQSVSTSSEMMTTHFRIERSQGGKSAKDSIRAETPTRWQVGENVMALVPSGWKMGFHARQGNLQITEFVPEGQTVDNWKSLLTIQIVFGGLSKTPRQVFEEAVALGRRLCPNEESVLITTGEENGYPFALWMQMCRNNPQVNQAEVTLFKVIQGNDSFYFVHRAWRMPTVSPNQAIPIDPNELVEWGRYMRHVGVCDTRIPARKCP
jgi:hypothetical protein